MLWENRRIMADIKLSYFNARGRAETARLILAHAGETREREREREERRRRSRRRRRRKRRKRRTDTNVRQTHVRCEIHRPETDRGPVCQRQVPAAVWAAAQPQVRR